MSFILIGYEAVDPQYSKYDGHLAITFGWEMNSDKPLQERYIIITPLMAKDYQDFINPPVKDEWCVGNRISFHHYQYYSPLIFDTSDMPKFTESIPVKPPKSSFNKRGERKVYEWSFGRWIHVGWEYKSEE